MLQALHKVTSTEKEVFRHGFVIRKEVRIFAESVIDNVGQLLRCEVFKAFDVLDVQSEDKLHDF